MSAAERVAAAHRGAAAWFRAPGRVNLMGDHTDYNDGFVLPMAIDRACVVAASPAPVVRVRSLEKGEQVEFGADGGGDVRPAWGRYAAAVARELAARGRPVVGMDATVGSDVPLGAGLSSSASFEVACAVALCGVAEWELAPQELAEACRAAEERASGVPCGIMDQLASVAGREGSALLIDCRSRAVEAVPLPESLAVLVVHSGVSRTLDASAYAERRRACEQLAERFGVPALRDLDPDRASQEPLARHVVSENGRVHAAADALRAGDVERLGGLFLESHASLRDDYAVSTPELDVLVGELVAAGAHGARLTGAGFGGCVVAACSAGRVDAVAATATARYRERTRREPQAFVCRAADGAGRLRAR